VWAFVDANNKVVINWELEHVLSPMEIHTTDGGQEVVAALVIYQGKANYITPSFLCVSLYNYPCR
jgi:hypothetical protein